MISARVAATALVTYGASNVSAVVLTIALLLRRLIRLARLAFERITRLYTGVLIAAFRRPAPARGGAFVDEQRVVAETKADACGIEIFIQSLGLCGSPVRY